MAETRPRFTFTRAQRLSGRRAFTAVFDARGRRNAGPLGVCSRPNGLNHCRLGLSVSRRVGNAATRSRIKRLLREAFRLTQHGRPVGYDLVIVVRPHEPLTLAEYQRLLDEAVRGVDRLWTHRRSKRPPRDPS